MKCHACGFVSFDHLSECKSCGGDLSSARNKLGFTGARPAVPFFLGGLLKDYQGGTAGPMRDEIPLDLTASVIPEIEFDDEFEVEAEPVRKDDLGMAHTQAASTMKHVPSVSDLIDESMMIDLSDDELNKLMEDHGPEKEVDLNLDMLFGGEAYPADETLAGTVSMNQGNGDLSGAQGRADALDDLFTLDLTDDDLNQFIQEPVAIETATPPSFGGNAFQEPVGVPEAEGADTVLELSDDDLHNMILELDETVAKKEKHMDV